MNRYIFAYGSLLDPDSLRSTLPDIDIDSLIPARLLSYVRTWDVAFPNDGSQGDKAYFDLDKSRPPVVLVVNLSVSTSVTAVNGILVPVDVGELSRLRNRELRYDLINVSAKTELYASSERPRLSVSTFVARDEFTQPADVARGLVPKSYMDSVLAGVSFWDERCSGFADDFQKSTVPMPEEKIAILDRVDN